MVEVVGRILWFLRLLYMKSFKWMSQVGWWFFIQGMKVVKSLDVGVVELNCMFL